ncbi:MAG: hypothetical protein ISS72_01255 [Candidatus Brocadiae bacterium]|nr:hypothetical protein [Candidatus Brocadiia bacterium]
MDPTFLRERQAREVRASRFRLGLIVVALLGLAYGMVHLSRQRDDTPVGAPDGPVVGRSVVAHKLPVAGIDPAAEGKTPDPLAVADADVAKKFAFLNDPKTFDQVEDRGTDVEPRPFFAMLYRVHQDTDDALRKEADATGTPDWKTLWDKPETLRGKAIQVAGRIVRIWTQRLGQNPMGLEQVTGYRIRRDPAAPSAGGPTIQLLDVYLIHRLPGALVHDQVVTRGRYLKPQVIPPEGQRFLDDPDLHVAVVLARRFDPLTYLDDAQPPGPIVDGNRPEARAFYWFIKHAMDATAAELQAKAALQITYVDLTTQPDRYRGTPIALRGQLARLHRIALPENPLGLADVFHGQVLGGYSNDPAKSDRQMNSFYCWQIPDGVRLKDEVVVYGYYMKNWVYTAADRRLITSPIIIGRHMQRVEIVRDYTIEIGIGIVAALTLFVLLVAYHRERTRQSAAREAQRQRQMARVPQNLNAVARRLARPSSPRPDATPPPDTQDDDRDSDDRETPDDPSSQAAGRAPEHG